MFSISASNFFLLVVNKKNKALIYQISIISTALNFIFVLNLYKEIISGVNYALDIIIYTLWYEIKGNFFRLRYLWVVYL